MRKTGQTVLLKGNFIPDYLEVATELCRCFCVELVKLLPVHRYSVDMFSSSGPSGL